MRVKKNNGTVLWAGLTNQLRSFFRAENVIFFVERARRMRNEPTEEEMKS